MIRSRTSLWPGRCWGSLLCLHDAPWFQHQPRPRRAVPPQRCQRLEVRPLRVLPMISFIVPAHNEEAWIDRCLSAIWNALRTVDTACEVIVVDDASTDATAAIARHNEAKVIPVAHRQISATRNAGARETRGDVLFFRRLATALFGNINYYCASTGTVTASSLSFGTS